MKHSIIVGYGLAGLAYASQMKLHEKDFVIIDTPKWNATRKAAGVMNPTVLKRYTLAWNANQFMVYAQDFYTRLEGHLKRTILERISIHRHFLNQTEQNNWATASNSIALQPYLDSNFSKDMAPTYKGSHGYGSVKNTGRLPTSTTLEVFKATLNSEEFISSEFDYDAVKIHDNHIEYKNIKAQYLVFCEGFGLKKNPFFNTLPLIGSKGELLLIKAPLLPRDSIIKAHGIFIVPVENDNFWIGATFNRKDKTTSPTQEGKDWLLKKLHQTVDVPFEIVQQNVCIRPTVADRRPLLGQHPIHKRLYLFNGLGTRGVLMSPLLSHWLFDFITIGTPLPEAVNLSRFDSITLSKK